jgi:hypothetical protein
VTELPGFSVLLPVYRRDDPEHLRRAVHSVTTEQTLRPAELVIVQDGPVGGRLAAEIDDLARTVGVPVRRVALERNVGLARALEAGLAQCRFDVVARMDADDVSRPERFALQLPHVARGVDVVGSAIQEFDDDELHPGVVRTPPLSDADIRRAARIRSPFNHPSVVFRRAAVAAAGGYEDLPLLEDYWLFARMLATGATALNVPQPLVLYRVGEGAYARRGGRAILRAELDLQRRLRRIGFTSLPQALRNVAVRGVYRLVPEAARRRLYRSLMLGRREELP